jgi:hypothetical protein
MFLQISESLAGFLRKLSRVIAQPQCGTHHILLIGALHISCGRHFATFAVRRITLV